MNTSAAKKYRILFTLFVMISFIFSMSNNLPSHALAQDVPTDTPDQETAMPEKDNLEVISPYFSIEHLTLPDGTELSGYIINGALP